MGIVGLLSWENAVSYVQLQCDECVGVLSTSSCREFRRYLVAVNKGSHAKKLILLSSNAVVRRP